MIDTLPGILCHRWLAWGTFDLPSSVVVSPVFEWHSGFPYSVVDVYRHYVGTPASERFPNYFSLDMTAFKTFDIFERKWDLGLQFFNITGHFNPRDVIAVSGAFLIKSEMLKPRAEAR